MNEEIISKNAVKIRDMVRRELVSLGAIEADEYVEVEIRLGSSVVVVDLGLIKNSAPHEVDVLFAKLVRDIPLKTQAPRIQALFQSLKLVTVGQVCRTLSASKLLKFRSFGRKSLASLKQALGEMGLSLDEYIDKQPGPRELAVLKKHLPIDNLHFMDAAVHDLLDEKGFRILQDLFPRSEFEQSLARIHMGDDETAYFMGEIERCLRRNTIPWY